MLPATRQRWHSRLYPSQSWYSIYRPQRGARLSWPGGWLEMVYPLNGHPSWNNRARCWLTSLMRPTTLATTPSRHLSRHTFSQDVKRMQRWCMTSRRCGCDVIEHLLWCSTQIQHQLPTQDTPECVCVRVCTKSVNVDTAIRNAYTVVVVCLLSRPTTVTMFYRLNYFAI